MFSSIVTDHWFRAVELSDVPASVGTRRVVVDSTLSQNRRLMVLDPVGTGGIVLVAPDLVRRLGFEAGAEIDAPALASAVSAADLELNGADHLYYFSTAEQTALRTEGLPTGVRELSEDDAELFAAFQSEAPSGELDEAFVELDHWLVFGVFVEDRLVCAASMYPWGGTTLADLGVITLPPFRGRGLARQTVRALSARALELGHEPQYRCQLDNHASVALADSAGLTRFATWDVVASDED